MVPTLLNDSLTVKLKLLFFVQTPQRKAHQQYDTWH